ALLEINGSYIRPDSPAFVTLHRVLLSSGGGFSYASREKVVACEGARFEIYAGDVKLLKGIFRRDDGGDERESNWKIDCKCALSADDDVVVVDGVRDAEVSVTVAGDGPAAVVVTEKVAMAAALRRRRRRRRGGCCELEEIPEEREGEIGSDECWCCDCGGGDGEEEMDGGDGGVEVEAEMEAVRWAVDVGIWVVCIGVGYLVTKASSSKRLRRKRFI
ncbi:PREDICTED: uncharacterized protein LOC105970480, partial [Erythranthe guttata]|uniref:uncharacterized protein LOC105970480 n=1 Tax=Erythranthe guttata TaxID=4155 RepID=UPI00064E0750